MAIWLPHLTLLLMFYDLTLMGIIIGWLLKEQDIKESKSDRNKKNIKN